MKPPPPLPPHIPLNSKKKRVFMDPDVIEIPPPPTPIVSRFNSTKQSKNKQVILHEIIDVDKEEDPIDVMILDKKFDIKNKGKSIGENFDGFFQAKDGISDHLLTSSPGENNMINVDGLDSDSLYDDGACMDFDFDNLMEFDEYSYLQSHFDNVDIPPGVEAPIPWLPDSDNNAKKTANGTNAFSTSNQMQSNGGGSWSLKPTHASKKLSSGSDSSFHNPMDSMCHASGVNLPSSWSIPTDCPKKFQLFKRFDTVEDHSDHHYTSKGSSMKQHPPPSGSHQRHGSKRIQEEWRILENDLPDSIFVRVYETRMDLLRAVIIGAEGTPYHDGLFFFDVFFPAGYPKVPPLVYYHSGGLRLNPNLYNCGKVCLSLLGTWQGNKNEKWQPGVSTVLQVLVSIQALILNQKPFFNEPGYERLSGSANGEKRSQEYSESTFFLSLKTMVYTMRRPPKHFEDFVLGHFINHANDILVACKAYMDGAQVGCLVKGGVQDVDEGDKSCSKSFKDSLPAYVDMLVKQFSQIGVQDTENFQTSENRGLLID
ncbi:hypothetical protein OIU76_025501 [Salix suchowensis]|nr:hypothetical protein OIU76_025501 [Salix suchowensis]